jgi:hypothetical protein
VAAIVNGIVPGLGTVSQVAVSAAAGLLTFTGGLEKLWQIGEPVLKALGNAWEAVSVALEPVFKAVANIAESFAKVVATAAVDFLQAMVEIVDDLSPAFELMGQIIAKIGELGKWVWESHLNGLRVFLQLAEKAAVAVGFIADATMRGTDAAFERIENKKAGVDTEWGKHSSGSDFDHRSPTPSQTGFESLTASFSRIQESVLRLGMGDPQKDTAKNTERMVGQLQDMNRKLDRLEPGLA